MGEGPAKSLKSIMLTVHCFEGIISFIYLLPVGRGPDFSFSSTVCIKRGIWMILVICITNIARMPSEVFVLLDSKIPVFKCNVSVHFF